MSNHPVPQYLSKSSKAWLRSIFDDFELEDYHASLAVIAAEALDRGEVARAALAEFGQTYRDDRDNVKVRPECRIVAEAAATYMRALRELGLDVEDSAIAHARSIRPNARLRNNGRNGR